MRRYRKALIMLIAGCLLAGIGALNLVVAQDPDEELIARGEYLTVIAGCADCHTPRLEQYRDINELTGEDARRFAFNSRQTKDESMLLAGGEFFDLGPRGFVESRNLTPHEETGLGTWSDEEIKRAFQQNIDIHGHNLFPLMPARIYNNMADEDADAIVAYLRSLPPIDNKIETFAEHQTYPPQGLPEPGFGPSAPDPSDIGAYGEYLINGVLICTDCHTPLDPETGQLNTELSFAGGQPFEGPWGIVYGGNITPHEETGTGTWSEGELRRAIMAGLRPDGRQLVLMPWEYFSGMQEPEIAALTNYILNELPAINREVPNAALEEGFEQFIGGPPAVVEEVDDDSNTTTIIIVAVVALVLLAGGYFWFLIGRSSSATA